MAAIIAFLFYLSAATTSKLQRRHIALRRQSDEGQVDFAFRVTTITFILSFGLLFFKSFTVNQSFSTVFLLAAICGISGAFALSAQYTAQRHTEAGVTSLLGNSTIPASILLSSIFLHERLGLHQMAGTLLLLIAAVMVSRQHRVSKWRFDKYFWLNVIAGLSLAFTLTAERSLIRENGLAAGTIISWGAQVLCLGIAAYLAKTRSQYDAADTAVTGGIRFVQQMSWVIFVVIIANLSVGSALATLSTITVFIAAAIFLNEREFLKQKIIGSLIATVGLLLMI